jgi:hypothetical protein
LPTSPNWHGIVFTQVTDRQGGRRKREIHHHHIGTNLPIERVPVFDVLGGQDWLNPGVCKNAPASLHSERMIIDDEH